MLATFIADNFKKGEPIFFADLRASGMHDGNIRYHVSEMIKNGSLARADAGVFYIPEIIEGFTSSLSTVLIATRKYITSGKHVYGYYSGYFLANSIGLSNQVPNVREIVSNKAPAIYRKVKIKNMTYILRKPVTKVTKENVDVLQFLEILKIYEDTLEEEACDGPSVLKKYIVDHDITLSKIDRYIKLFPQKVYKTIYETGIYPILAQQQSASR